MKKKIFALLLVVLMLVPFIVACGGNDTNTDSNTNTNTESNTPIDSSKPSDTGSGDTTTVEKVDTKTDKSQKWSGKTLDVLASGWGQDAAGEDPTYGGYNTHAWSQPELYVREQNAMEDIKMGVTINKAVWARQLKIKEVYGVTLKWHRAGSNSSMQNEMQTGLEAGAAKYHIAIPRAYEAQSLIAADTVYDLANSKYIDLTKSYYNQAAVDSFSVYGHTFYVAGDFSYLDEYTAFVIFYNQAVSQSIPTFPNLYNKVENGTWTISELAKWGQFVGKDDDGTQGYQDTDTYGFGTTALSTFFQSSGIQQVSVDKSSGNKDTYKYHITLNDANVPALVNELVNIKTSNWARTAWDGGYGAMLTSFKNGKLLFYQEVTQKIFEFPAQSENFKVAVLPMPKLNKDQENYSAPFASQATVMCVPKCTTDREMSEYFFDVLSWTGQDYVMKAYYQSMLSKLYDDGESSREDAYEILTQYVYPNLSYDQGYIHEAMGAKFMTGVQSDTITNATPSSSPFMTYYTESFNDAKDKLDNEKTGWNTYAKNYKD